ncbi:Hypothetical_protein [Hexamita inflata]|uniref:Hypothetical_protein n=1 Tax=Hexamita inflata TaxID=28002 RepID=A0AA86V3P0_9EUKA|nr:Hypothetical protein HINF_LOCUS62791 [Hexamita inflata]
MWKKARKNTQTRIFATRYVQTKNAPCFIAQNPAKTHLSYAYSFCCFHFINNVRNFLSKPKLMLRLFCGSQTYEMNSFISSDKKTVQMAHSCFSSKIIAHLGQISNQVLWISIPVSTSWSLISCLVQDQSDVQTVRHRQFKTKDLFQRQDSTNLDVSCHHHTF